MGERIKGKDEFVYCGLHPGISCREVHLEDDIIIVKLREKVYDLENKKIPEARREGARDVLESEEIKWMEITLRDIASVTPKNGSVCEWAIKAIDKFQSLKYKLEGDK